MKRPFYRHAFAQVGVAILLGIVLGVCAPEWAQQLKPLGDWFIAAVKLLVAPIVFFTVAPGIAAMGNLRQLGRVGIKALVYFEAVSLLALVVGLLVAHLLQPGTHFVLDGARKGKLPAGLADVHAQGLLATLADTFMSSSILQVLALALLCGVVLAQAGARAERITALGERVGGWLFMLANWLMKIAPLAAFGAIAYTVGRHGLASVTPLLALLAALYLASILYVLIVLATVARMAGFGLLAFLRYIKEELLLVFGTSSSFPAMPGLIEKLAAAGCAKAVVGVVIPAGYSFNLNGTNIYLAVALVFLAQALHIDLGFAHYATIIAVAMVSSKGASGVAGSAFIALAATIAAVPGIPETSLVYIVGIERLLKCRSLTNIIGNGVGCLAISAWDGSLDRARLRQVGLA